MAKLNERSVSQLGCEQERSQGPAGMREELGCANTPEGAGSPTGNSSCLTSKEGIRVLGKTVGNLHALSLTNALG